MVILGLIHRTKLVWINGNELWSKTFFSVCIWPKSWVWNIFIPDKLRLFGYVMIFIIYLSGRKLKEKQEILTNLHEKAKNKADQLNVGGGISIWPEMENMRLSKSETIYLSISCIFLIITTSFLFLKLHGKFLLFGSSLNDCVGEWCLKYINETRSHFYYVHLLTFFPNFKHTC